MDYNYSKLDSPEDNMKSNFNEAMFVMRRLDTLQRRINDILNPNIFFFNNEQNVYNYEVKFEDLKAMVKEMWGKFNKDEKKDCLLMEEIIQEMLISFPPHRKQGNTITFNKEKGYKVKKALEIFEKYIKVWKENHGYGSPGNDDEGLF